MHAFWEEIREGTGIGLIRMGPHCYKMGDPYKFTVVGNHVEGQPVELKGLGCVKYTREIHDALALCLLSEGFANYRLERYKDGIQVPQRSARIRLSSTHMKEHIMAVKNAHDSSVAHWEHAVKEAGDPNLTALAQAVLDQIRPLGAGVEAPSKLGDKVRASLPLCDAIDNLAAAGADLPQDTAQQRKIGQALHSSGVVIKHLINDSLKRTGIAAAAV